MKLTIFTLSMLFSTFSFAEAVDGEIFYKLPDGTMAVREVVLDVPARGQGEVILSGNGFEWRSSDFESQTYHGQTVFSVSFKTEFAGKKSIIKLRGTYFKTDDHIKYYGNLYKLKKGKVKYIGGFEFNYPRSL